MDTNRGEVYGVLHLTEEQRQARAESAAEKQRERVKAEAAKRAQPYAHASLGNSQRQSHVDSRSPYMARAPRERDAPALMAGKHDRRGIMAARGREAPSNERKYTFAEALSSRDVAKLKGMKSR